MAYPYKAVLMDADDTLFDFGAGNRRAVNALMDEIGYHHPDRFDQYQEINHACWEALERGEMTQAELQVARWARFLERYGLDNDPETTANRFVEILGQQVILLPHAEEAMKFIAARLPVVILTNGITAVQKSRMAKSAVRDYISDLVISQEVGISKPNPGIFQYALERLGLKPEEVIMIGDSPSSDILGANNAGIDACWYNPKGKTLPEGVHAKYTITDLRQLMQ
ncbi:MAG: YjjG family noncanonical pyrimidine nucleotidase [Clostridia bacterium]|nr:YjjG family noncanonical pyrimidine nucleotidase [Clostridia bacterium]